MNIDDFRYMWCGKHLKTLPPQHADLLAPIDIRRPGKDRALLLLHGFSSTPAVFRELLSAFTHYHAVVCPVLPGHADSIASFAKVQASEWLTAAEEACASLIQNYQKVDVMGLSMGGVLACHLSARFTLNHLYLLAPALNLQINIKPIMLLARILYFLGFKSIRNLAGNLRSKQFSELTYRQLPVHAVIEILTLIDEFQFVPPNCPTDLFVGEFDEVVDSKKVALRFAQLPNVNIHWLTKSAHVLPLDGDRDRIIDCVNSEKP